MGGSFPLLSGGIAIFRVPSRAVPSATPTPRASTESDLSARFARSCKETKLARELCSHARASRWKNSVQLRVFASSGPSGTALSGHFSAQRCTCYPSQAWAWAKACLSAATAKPLKSEEYPMNTTQIGKQSSNVTTNTETSNIATLPAKSSRPTCSFSSSSLKQDTARD